MFRTILERWLKFVRKADIATDLMAEYGVHLWHSLLYFLSYFTGDMEDRLREMTHKFKAWLDKVTDGDYDPEYEDDIIVRMWEQKFGGMNND